MHYKSKLRNFLYNRRVKRNQNTLQKLYPKRGVRVLGEVQGILGQVIDWNDGALEIPLRFKVKKDFKLPKN